MFKKILLASDGSENAQRAAALTGTFAARLGGELTLMHVSDLNRELHHFGGDENAEMTLEAFHRYRDNLNRAALEHTGAVLKQAHIPFVERREIGHPAQEIIRVAEAEKFDLVALGNRGLGSFKSLLLGSVSDRVLHHAPCAILVAPHREHQEADTHKPSGGLPEIRRILIASDGSEPASKAAHQAAELAKAFAAELLLLTVYQPPVVAPVFPEGPIDYDTLQRYGEEMQAAIEKRTEAIFADAGVTCRAIRELGHPVDRIVETAKTEKADLIVMGSRGQSEWRALLLGSTSDGVLHHAPCPVLIVR